MRRREALQAVERWNDVRTGCNFPGVLGRIPATELGTVCTIVDALLHTDAQIHKCTTRLFVLLVFPKGSNWLQQQLQMLLGEEMGQIKQI